MMITIFSNLDWFCSLHDMVKTRKMIMQLFSKFKLVLHAKPLVKAIVHM